MVRQCVAAVGMVTIPSVHARWPLPLTARGISHLLKEFSLAAGYEIQKVWVLFGLTYPEQYDMQWHSQPKVSYMAFARWHTVTSVLT